jgi:twitching motility protein PilU
VLKDVAMTKRGLVIFVGATGSGKTTSLAAMVDWRNENSYGHIITDRRPGRVRAPAQELHRHPARSRHRHRQLGAALKNTLRQAPDVILMGEIRDRETMEHAMAFAETGHLCMATLHANSANQALDRIINFFPEERRAAAADGPVAQPARAGLAAPDAAPGRQGPHRRGRDHAQHAADLRPDLQGRGGEIKEIMKKLARTGHADLRPGAVRPLRGNHITYEDALRNADSVNDLRLQIKLQQPARSPGPGGRHRAPDIV